MTGMLEEETRQLLMQLRRTGAEPSDIEVKAAVEGLPRTVPETLSAFANGSGGTLLLGVSETAGFVPVSGFNASATRDALAGACADQVRPPVRAAVEIVPVDEAEVVRIDVEGLDPVDKPCFVSNRGEYNGSFIRGGDGDRRLTHYEVSQFLANRAQPEHDRQPVTEATPADLDPELVEQFLGVVRGRSARFAQRGDEDLLRQLGVTTVVDGRVHPTLAGLLCFGQFPQQFFPQLFVSFVALPGLTMGEVSPEGSRFLDNQTLDGPIPRVVEDVAHAAVRNMRRGALIHGVGREDRYDYPLDVIRELVVNALMHRDYSPEARGTQIQIELYPGRLEVRSPGGLYGPNTPEILGTVEQRSTSRNAMLAKLLSDVPLPNRREQMLCENRGSGLLAVVQELRRVGMSPPEFRVSPGSVDVVVPQHALLSDEVRGWIASLGHPGLSDQQQLALAMMRGGRITNAMLRTWGLDMHEASQALRDLVARGLAVKSGGKRYARYQLAPGVGHERTSSGQATSGQRDSDDILMAIRAGHTTARAIAAALNVKHKTALRRINKLVDIGVLERTQPATSPSQSYRVVEEVT